MYRLLVALMLALAAAGCARAPVDGAAEPSIRYTVVVDGRIARTLTAPPGTRWLSAVVQPRSGESAIWQTYGATYVYVVLQPREKGISDEGGRKLNLGGAVEYYRDLKTKQENGNDIVIRGKPIQEVEIDRKGLVLSSGKPLVLTLTEGLQVEIALIPPPAAPAPRP